MALKSRTKPQEEPSAWVVDARHAASRAEGLDRRLHVRRPALGQLLVADRVAASFKAELLGILWQETEGAKF